MVLRNGIDVFEHFLLRFVDVEPPTVHGAGSDVEEFFQTDIGETGRRRPFAETGDENTRKTGSVNVYPDAEHRSGVEHAVDTGF